MKRTAEFVMGLLGGIFGFFGGIAGLCVGTVDNAFFAGSSDYDITTLGWSALGAATLGIVATAFVKSKPKLGGWLMIISAIWGVISISLFFALPGILLFVGGLMALIRKDDATPTLPHAGQNVPK